MIPANSALPERWSHRLMEEPMPSRWTSSRQTRIDLAVQAATERSSKTSTPG